MPAKDKLKVSAPQVSEFTTREAILEERRRCATDFAYFAEKYCKIRNKDGESVPFKLNRVQRDLLAMIERQWASDRGYVRIVVLKARQQGFSTFMQAYSYWWLKHRSTKQAFVVANLKKVSEALFGMLQYTHKMMPEKMRPKLSKGSVRQMVFSDLDTSIEVDTAGAEDLGRGRTLNLAWLSEVAFWQESTAQKNLQSIIVACPKKKNSIVIVESTANGVSGAYYDLYHRAPGNGFEQFFSPWFYSEDYTDEDYGPDFGVDSTPGELTIEEKELMAEHGLTLGQINWRRGEMLRAETHEDFMREFPATPQDAFQNSGSPLFSPVHLETLRKAAVNPVKRLHYNEADDVFEERKDRQGDLTLFEEPVKGKVYYIGADVAQGTGRGDYSIAQILDEDRRQVGIYRSNKIDPWFYGQVLNRLGRMFNTAEIIIEVNAVGHTAKSRLSREFHYPNLYLRVRDEKVSDEYTDNIGFDTNRKTKPLIISRLQDAVKKGNIIVNCPITLDEMRTFIRTDAGGLEASPGAHDDTVMALAMANFIHKGKREPLPLDLIEESFLPAY